MKKVINLLLAVLMLISVVPMAASAASTEVKQRNCGFCGKLLTGTYVEASCTKGAHYRTYCTDCRTSFDFEFDKTKPALGHIEAVETVEVSCTNRGHERHYCSRCGENFYWTNIVEPLGHNYVYFERDSSLEKDVCLQERYCTRCNAEDHTHNLNGHSSPNSDNKCNICNFDFEKDCGHLCHKGGFWYKFCLFFWKLFKTNKVCSCGMYHY